MIQNETQKYKYSKKEKASLSYQETSSSIMYVTEVSEVKDQRGGKIYIYIYIYIFEERVAENLIHCIFSWIQVQRNSSTRKMNTLLNLP